MAGPWGPPPPPPPRGPPPPPPGGGGGVRAFSRIAWPPPGARERVNVSPFFTRLVSNAIEWRASVA